MKKEIIAELSLDVYEATCDLWKAKLERVEKGEHVWGLFTGKTYKMK